MVANLFIFNFKPVMKKNNQYLLFGKRLFFFALLIVFVDIIVGKAIEHFYHKVKYGQTVRIEHAMMNATENVIIFGSSRATHHYDSDIFEASFGLSAYNTGIDGETILYYYCVLEAILTRCTPQIIILDLNSNEFVKNKKSYDILYLLLPYYNKYKQIQPIVNLRSRYEFIKAYSNLYRYNSFLLPVILNNIMYRKEESTKGFTPLYGVYDFKHNNNEGDTSAELDSVKISVFKTFLQKAKEKTGKVFVIVSPSLRKEDRNTASLQIAANICQEKGIPFMLYNQSDFFNSHPEYFKDATHLNDQGAKIYSQMVSSDMQKILSSKYPK